MLKNKSRDENKKCKKDISKIECYACGKMGNYANKCPTREKQHSNQENKKEQVRTAHVTWNASTFVTYHEKNSDSEKRFKQGWMCV